ncbi:MULTISPECIES: 50S ribosomal protein L21 [Chryseobacterium]|jgi:large subunit ribosomal protein L21|uniref:Large ribosomal subunit protein bL21 n=2 Tax=Chryseobacterium TaxID=59732 RepID=A0A411DPG2_CHRID|nr:MULTISPECIES: 50S ribosomal protein L21 [Chryseobacterium]QBA22194.1 50S ribosomal protein L21 [Chryseobacterium indologenes]MCC3217573.1 50S ribosomal protein L21 [Chryseobacterium sp. X308]MCD9618855.1 50S ribosomal protein L21 [Chryseobacterium gleum]MCE4066593.1 50S ribosomal protein L21 [Chryseobacterium gleum]PWW15327.1 large subunit ribosomal protein L21 [Chryseobacterium sp. AG844]
MFAIVEIAGLQYKVEQDQKLFVNRLKGDKGGKVSFDKVLLTVNGAITVGAPAVNGITVEAEILDHVKADKVIVFKKKRRKGYKVKNGHRQSLTQIVITGITGFEGGAKKAAAKKETVKGEVLSDNATVNFGEDHELNYHLKKNNLSQSKENRETLITLGKAVKVELEKNVLTHEEVDAAIIKNIDQFKALNK